MKERVVVAGATGYLGRHLVAEASDRGYRVRAIVRSRARAEKPGLFGSPSLAGHVDECAGVAVFLASALASYVTGQTIHVDGGTSAASGWYHHPDDGHYVLGPS